MADNILKIKDWIKEEVQFVMLNPNVAKRIRDNLVFTVRVCHNKGQLPSDIDHIRIIGFDNNLINVEVAIKFNYKDGMHFYSFEMNDLNDQLAIGTINEKGVLGLSIPTLKS